MTHFCRLDWTLPEQNSLKSQFPQREQKMSRNIFVDLSLIKVCEGSPANNLELCVLPVMNCSPQLVDTEMQWCELKCVIEVPGSAD